MEWREKHEADTSSILNVKIKNVYLHVQDTNTSVMLCVCACGQFLLSAPGTSQELLEEDTFVTEVIFVVKGFQRHIFKVQEFLFM